VFEPGRELFIGNARGVAQSDPLQIVTARGFRDGVLVKFAGIEDRNAAELIRDRFLFLPADLLQPPAADQVYVHELKGMRVELVGGETVGTVIDIFELPQGLALDVSRKGAKSVIIPYDRVVTSVDRQAKLIRIDPPEGLLD
jgi:16S rRNA processing protein RimM